MIKRTCVICGKEFIGTSASKYCSEKCRNTPIYTDEFNGEIHGQLKIINAYRKKSTVYAICECKCGNICTVRYDSLKTGVTVSCGHKVHEQQNKSKAIDLTGKANKYGCVAIKRLDIKSKSRNYIWLCKCPACGKEFEVSTSAFPTKESCGCLKYKKNIDNIKKAWEINEDLYLEDTSIMAISNKKMLKNNKSGVKGVFWDSTRNRWVAQIEFKKKNYYLGAYSDIKEAATARKEAEDALFGNFLEWFCETYPERWEKLNKSKGKRKK